MVPGVPSVKLLLHFNRAILPDVHSGLLEFQGVRLSLGDAEDVGVGYREKGEGNEEGGTGGQNGVRDVHGEVTVIHVFVQST